MNEPLNSLFGGIRIEAKQDSENMMLFCLFGRQLFLG